MPINITVYDDNVIPIETANQCNPTAITMFATKYKSGEHLKDRLVTDPLKSTYGRITMSVYGKGSITNMKYLESVNRETDLTKFMSKVNTSAKIHMSVHPEESLLQDFNSEIKILRINSFKKTDKLMNEIVLGKQFTKDFHAYIKETELGGGGTTIGKLNITLEVKRFEHVSYTFPSGYLKNAITPGFVKVSNDLMEVYAEQWGVFKVYCDAGEVTLKVVPGMRVKEQLIPGSGLNNLPTDIVPDPLPGETDIYPPNPDGGDPGQGGGTQPPTTGGGTGGDGTDQGGAGGVTPPTESGNGDGNTDTTHPDTGTEGGKDETEPTPPTTEGSGDTDSGTVTPTPPADDTGTASSEQNNN